MTTASLAWMGYVVAQIGVREVPGPRNSPIIARWLTALKAWWCDDATPWCGVFVAHVMQKSGFCLPRHWYRARDWASWGTRCEPAYGAICVVERPGGGHVLFVTRISAAFVWGVGGNQGDRVCEAKFDRSRVIGFRWPPGLTAPSPLRPVAGDEALLSEIEA